MTGIAYIFMFLKIFILVGLNIYARILWLESVFFILTFVQNVYFFRISCFLPTHVLCSSSFSLLLLQK